MWFERFRLEATNRVKETGERLRARIRRDSEQNRVGELKHEGEGLRSSPIHRKQFLQFENEHYRKIWNRRNLLEKKNRNLSNVRVWIVGGSKIYAKIQVEEGRMLPLAGGDFSNSNHRRQGFPARRFKMRVWRMLLSTRLCCRDRKKGPRGTRPGGFHWEKWIVLFPLTSILILRVIQVGNRELSLFRDCCRFVFIKCVGNGGIVESGQTGQAEISESLCR